MSHLFFPSITNIMAIINSMGVGRSRKSMGNVTYRTVRGRTIGSQKRSGDVVTRVPNAVQEQSRALFRAISMYISLHRADVNASFDKTKYGSQGNYFMKWNKQAIRAAVSGVIYGNSSMEEIVSAIETYATENPKSIYRVKKSGVPPMYLTGAWESSDNPTPVLPPTGVRVNGAAGQKSAAFVASTPLLGAVDATTACVVSDSDAVFSGITASSITPYDADGAALSNGASIKDVVASVNSVSFNLTVDDAISGGKDVHAFKIGSAFYQQL